MFWGYCAVKMNSIYDMIFKRKSFHIFKDINEQITKDELNGIKNYFQNVSPLFDDIKTDLNIVPAEETTCRRGQEYCILLYSEKKDNYLQNIGYMGEQLDLYLASKNIGALWYGIGKCDKPYNGLDFVIMIAISKVAQDKFRKDMFLSKRKPLDEIWSGEKIENVSEIIRFSPSACNTQPWKIENKRENGKTVLEIYRYMKEGKRGIMPIEKVSYYNRIDIGILLLFLELCLNRENIEFNREILADNGTNETYTLFAKYYLADK